MALKILKKKADTPTKLPEGGERFVWNELPVVTREAQPSYTEILKNPRKSPKKSPS